jgi:hypothetical protein
MFREEASKEKLGFESHWDSAVGSEAVAARGKRGNREDGFVGIFGLSPSTAARTAVVGVVDGEGSGESSMADWRVPETGRFRRLTNGAPYSLCLSRPG